MPKGWRAGVAPLAIVALTALGTPLYPARANEPPAVQGAAMTTPQSFAPLIARVKPAVVNIATTELVHSANRELLPQMPKFPPGSPFSEFFREFQFPEPEQPVAHSLTALGSGFIIDPSGYIVTNNHVIENGTNIKVTLQDGETLTAKVVGHDKLTDLAVLKVSADHPLPYVQFGDSDKAEVGDWVVSVGNPFGLGGTVTAGILSARGRNINEGPYDDFLQIDAPINQGNSGGPTFNGRGQVIGINTAIISPNGGGSVGIGFAIPSDLARPVVEELKSSGKIVRGWLGVEVQAIRPEMEDALGMKNTDGALVASVVEDGPAAKAGIRPGDVITRFGGQGIVHLRDLTWAVANTEPGKDVTMALLRNGEEKTERVAVGKLDEQRLEEASSAQAEQPKVGMKLAGITPEVRQEYDLPRTARGVLVVDVTAGSPADQAGIQPEDIINEVDHVTVTSPRQVSEALRAAREKGKKSVALYIDRGGQKLFAALGLGDGGRS